MIGSSGSSACSFRVRAIQRFRATLCRNVLPRNGAGSAIVMLQIWSSAFCERDFRGTETFEAHRTNVSRFEKYQAGERTAGNELARANTAFVAPEIGQDNGDAERIACRMPTDLVYS